ncbi:MBL fold metallo-hydrolase [Euzebya rosea]|uniref:MBL fold metallo-hydrolase n=1 Tax=Euzebya rosea TaxID=2052804 RepID=UPI000D3E7915|nr:MBL fold metallo-hydrolase [Euzebya rosea]
MSPSPDEPVRPSPMEVIRDDLVSVDTLTAGMTKVTAGYLLQTPRPTLVECGPAVSIQSVIDGLRAHGLDPDDLAYLVISHIHLDHGGGAGDVAEAFPNATIVVHEVGVRHMVDPERLNASSKRVYGPLYDSVYGACTPIDQSRIIGVGERETLDLGGGRRLELFQTPGHAKHHIGIFDPDTGDLFVGDSVGVKMPGMDVIRPATPPPDFDYVLAQRSLDTYLSLTPKTVHLAHYGAVDPPMEALQEAKDRLELWMEAAEAAWSDNADLDHVAETLGHRFASEVVEVDGDPDAKGRVELLSGIRSNAMGLVRYLDLKEQGRVAT